MRAYARSLPVLGILMLSGACGPANQPTTPQTPANVAPTGTGQTIASGPTPELGLVAEPADVVAIARWRSPGQTFATIQAWFGVPVPTGEIEHELFRVPENANLVALDAPVDMVVALDPKSSDADPQPFAAFSVGLRSFEDARRAFDQRHRVKEIQPNVYKVEIGRGSELSCLIAPAAGPAPGRLVCGDRDRDVEALYPYMTRGLPMSPVPTRDLHAEVRFAPVQRRFGRQLPVYLNYLSTYLSHQFGTGDRKLDSSMTDAMTGLSNETVAVLNDMDTMAFDISIGAADRTADADFDLKFKARNSWIAQRMFYKAGEAGAAPAPFWRLPGDSDMAFYNRGDDAKAYDGLRRGGGSLLDALLARGKFPAGQRKAVASLWDRLFLDAPMSVSASGSIDTPPIRPDEDILTQLRASMTAMLGWHVWGFEETSNRPMIWMRDMAAIYNGPGVKQWIHDQTGLDLKQLPDVRMVPFNGKGLDKGTQAIEITIPVPKELGTSAPAKAMAPLKYWVVVMPDGGRTWVGAAADRASLEKHLAMVKSGAPDAQTLASRPGLESLRSGKDVSAGFLSVASLAASASDNFLSVLRGSRHGRFSGSPTSAMMTNLPNHGRTPILMTSSARAASPSEVNIKLHMSKGSVDDLQTLLGNLGMRGRP